MYEQPQGSVLPRIGGVIAAVILGYASLAFASVHADDALEIQAGGWVTHYDGVLLSRVEDGNEGVIEFGARDFTLRRLTPRLSPPAAPVGDYTVRVIPHDGSVQGFADEHCRRSVAVFHHVSGSTFIRLTCP